MRKTKQSCFPNVFSTTPSDFSTIPSDSRRVFFSPQEEDEEIDPDVRELGDYFNIEERWVAGHASLTMINDRVLSIEYPGNI